MPRNGSQVKLRRILAPVDFSESMARTLQYAAALARKHGATITLLHVVTPDRSRLFRWITRSESAEEMRDAGERQLRELVDTLWGDEVKAETVVAIGEEPHLEIINEAKETKADLILLSSCGAVGPGGLVRSNTAAKVVQNAPCPVLVVPLFGHGFVVDSPVLRSFDR
jgi:nucleotide-binding universal stress UspA family protein